MATVLLFLGLLYLRAVEPAVVKFELAIPALVFAGLFALAFDCFMIGPVVKAIVRKVDGSPEP